jgi:hypothetical protein
MDGTMIVAMAVAIPVILFPAAFIWFLNISGLMTVWKETRAREKRREKARRETLA